MSRIFYKNSANIGGTVSLKEQKLMKEIYHWTFIVMTYLPVNRVKWPVL